jgi:hypothetical protein
MSSPLALAAVTAVLKDLLNEGLINNDLSQVGSFLVTAMPPDRITTGNTEANQLNLFLYQVTSNPGWRNEGLPSRGPGGERLTNPPLALDLHYLLTAYGQTDLNAEILLGYAMELLHEQRVLPRGAIRRSLSPNNPVNVALIPKDAEGRTAIDLADQAEIIKITPHYLSADELSRLWTAMQARYRPSVAYQVSTVLIQSTRSTRAALPVLQRGSGDHGVDTQPTVDAPPPMLPTLFSLAIVTPDGRMPAGAELGDTLLLDGALLAGDVVTAEFQHRLLTAPLEVPVTPGSGPLQAVVALPKATAGTTATDWPAGNYTIALRIERAGQPVRRSNALAFNLVPRLSAAPQLQTGGGLLDLTLDFFPDAWPAQRIDIFVADEAFRPAAPSVKTGSLKVSILGVRPAAGPVPVRLRVDGVDTQVVRDPHAQPLQFDPQQMVNLPL